MVIVKGMVQMNRFAAVICLLALVSFTSCSGISVETDFDPETDFSIYRTYKWVDHIKDSQKGMMKDPLIKKHVISAANRELAEKGFVPAGNSRPDLLIAFHIGSKKKIDVDHYYYNYGRRGHWREHDVRVRKYREGTLIIDIVDGKNKELVWRGWAKGVLHGREDAADYVEEAAARILRRFPPD